MNKKNSSAKPKISISEFRGKKIFPLVLFDLMNEIGKYKHREQLDNEHKYSRPGVRETIECWKLQKASKYMSI